MDIEQLQAQLAALDIEKHIAAEDTPDLDLYMDQVITFFENHLAHTKRRPEDKLLTKTMINNYTKNKLMMPAVKKKYTKDHLLLLALIYELKQVTSLEDIKTLFSLMDSPADAAKDQPSAALRAVYDAYLDFQPLQSQTLQDTLGRLVAEGEKKAASLEGDAAKKALICLLLFEQSLSYKRLAEKLLDELSGAKDA